MKYRWMDGMMDGKMKDCERIILLPFQGGYTMG